MWSILPPLFYVRGTDAQEPPCLIMFLVCCKSSHVKLDFPRNMFPRNLRGKPKSLGNFGSYYSGLVFEFLPIGFHVMFIDFLNYSSTLE